jgi:hypothetical protein
LGSIPFELSDEKLAVDTREAALLLNVLPRIIQNCILVKVLPARKIGRRTVISARALEIFLRSDRESPSLHTKDGRANELDRTHVPIVGAGISRCSQFLF